MTRKKPPHLRLLEGNPGKRRVTPRGVDPIGDAVSPLWLTGYALEVWHRVMGAMPGGVYRRTDTEILAAYCSACAQHREATLRLTIEGPVLIGPRGRRIRNPWCNVQRDAARQIESLGRRLGLDPTSREHLPPPPAPVPNKFAGLIGVDPSITTTGDHDDDND